MQLSVIIATYNNEKYIKEALNCLTEQGFTQGKQEVVVINDGSTDNTEKIVDEFCAKYPYIKKVNKINGGVSSARNLGLKEASGDYIAFVDGDDVIGKNTFLPIIDLCIKENLDGFYYEFTKDINKLKSNVEVDWLKENVEYLRFKLTYEIWRVIFKREIIIKNNLSFDESLVICEDSLFSNYYSRLTKKVGYLKSPLYYYRTNDKSLTHSNISEEKMLCRIKLLKIILDSLPKYFDNVYFPGCLPCYLSYGIQTLLWENMKRKIKPSKTIKKLKEIGVSPKDIKHKREEKSFKNKLQYSFRFLSNYKVICFLYRIFK